MTSPKPKDPAIKRVLVTGATGFLGRAILTELSHHGVDVIAACRTPERLPSAFTGEVRVGDLTDPAYRAQLVEGVDAICHAGTWGAFYGHAEAEKRLFLDPTMALLDLAVAAGVKRFLIASTVAIAQKPATKGAPVDDFAPNRRTGFWPHLDMLGEVDQRMRELACDDTRMIAMRLGHFVGAGVSLGLVPALIPRLKTRLVPWLGRARARMPMVTDTDMARAFALAATVEGVAAYDSFNVHSGQLPTLREVFTEISREARVPLPLFAAPYWSGYIFGRLMEALPTPTPFLTRSLVLVAEDWNTPITHARDVLGYAPQDDWRAAVKASVAERRALGFAWPRLGQAVTSSVAAPR